MRAVKACAFALSLFLLAVFASPVDAQAAAGPSPEAKEAMNLGLEAAKEKDWKAANKHFYKALKFDFTASPVLFNMAYVHDRMGVDEFKAIAYYRAYLASAPNAKNAGGIGKRIGELETRIKAKAMKLVALAKRTASALRRTRNRDLALMNIAIVHAAIGDFQAALSKAARLKRPLDDTAIVGIAKFQAEYGDITGARKTIGKLKDSSNNATFFAHLAKVQAEAGDIDGALATVASISGLDKNNTQPFAYSNISRHLIKVGDYSRAKIAAALAIQTMKPDHHMWRTISELLAKTGNIEEAWKAAAIAKSQKNNGDRYCGFTTLARLLAISGDYARARKALDEVPEGERECGRSRVEKLVDGLEQARSDLKQATDDEERKAAQNEIREFLWYWPDELEGPRLPLLKREVLYWLHNPGFASVLWGLEGRIRFIEQKKVQDHAPGLVGDLVKQIMTALMRQRRMAAYWQARHI